MSLLFISTFLEHSLAPSYESLDFIGYSSSSGRFGKLFSLWDLFCWSFTSRWREKLKILENSEISFSISIFTFRYSISIFRPIYRYIDIDIEYRPTLLWATESQSRRESTSFSICLVYIFR